MTPEQMSGGLCSLMHAVHEARALLGQALGATRQRVYWLAGLGQCALAEGSQELAAEHLGACLALLEGLGSSSSAGDARAVLELAEALGVEVAPGTFAD